MRKQCLAHPSCPFARAYDIIGDWWSLLIMAQIVLGGDRRFSEIQQNLGMAKNVLSARLRKLVAQGVLEKQPVEGSAYDQYVPTQIGNDLYKVLVALREWGDLHFAPEDREPANQIVDRRTGEPVASIVLLDFQGRPLTLDDITLSPTRPDADST